MWLCVYCDGGFGREVMDLARRLNRRYGRWEGIAFISEGAHSAINYDAEVFEPEQAVRRFGANGFEAVIANGEPFVRKKLRERLEGLGVRLATLVDDTSVISDSATLGSGAIVLPGCFVSSRAKVGGNVALIVGTAVGHDAELGDNSLLAGHVNVGGWSKVGSEVYVGMGAQIKDRVTVGPGTIIGMGAVVFNDIPGDVIALGNPCRVAKPNSEKKVFP